MTAASAAMGNKDIEKLVPAVIEAMAKPEKVADTIHALGATTFVAAVTGTAHILVLTDSTTICFDVLAVYAEQVLASSMTLNMITGQPLVRNILVPAILYTVCCRRQ